MNKRKFMGMSVVDLKKFYDSAVGKRSKFRKIAESYNSAVYSIEGFYFDRLCLELDKFVESFRGLSVFSVSLSDVEHNFIVNIVNPVLKGFVSKNVCLRDNVYLYKRGLGIIHPHNVKISFLNNPIGELAVLSDLADDFVFDGLSVYKSRVIKKLADFCFEFVKLRDSIENFKLVSRVGKDVYNIFVDRVSIGSSSHSCYFNKFVDLSSFNRNHFYDSEIRSLDCFVFDPSLFDRVVHFQKGLASRVKRFEDSVRVAFSKELLFKSI